MMHWRSLFVAVFLMPPWAGPVEKAAAQIQPIYVIDKPSAGILPHGAFHLRGRIGPESSLLASARVGFGNRLQVGASFGAQKVFERDNPEFNDQVGFQVRLRVFEESRAPALALGFDSQGLGQYHGEEGLERYDRKSLGFYGVLSKNYRLFVGELSVHGGMSWSTEREDDNDPNVFGGVDWTWFERVAFLLDGDLALNDNTDDGAFGRGGVYLDAGLRVFYGEAFTMTLIFRDLSANLEGSNSVGREFELAFIDFF